MCISTKILDMLYLMFISTNMVLKEKFGHLGQIHPYYNQWKVVHLQCSLLIVQYTMLIIQYLIIKLIILVFNFSSIVSLQSKRYTGDLITIEWSSMNHYAHEDYLSSLEKNMLAQIYNQSVLSLSSSSTIAQSKCFDSYSHSHL